LPESADRSRLAELALAAERVRYSGAEPRAAELEEPIAGGRVLLDRLEAGGRNRRDAGASGLDASVPG
jgi:hypothetical protein